MNCTAVSILGILFHAGLELEEKLRETQAEAEELRSQDRHEDNLARLEARIGSPRPSHGSLTDHTALHRDPLHLLLRELSTAALIRAQPFKLVNKNTDEQVPDDEGTHEEPRDRE